MKSGFLHGLPFRLVELQNLRAYFGTNRANLNLGSTPQEKRESSCFSKKLFGLHGRENKHVFSTDTVLGCEKIIITLIGQNIGIRRCKTINFLP